MNVERCETVPYYAMVGYAVLARVYRLVGDDAACQRAVQNIQNILENYPSMPARIYVLFVTRLWVKDAIFAPFRQFLTAQRSLRTSSFEAELLQLVIGRFSMEQGGHAASDEALKLAGRTASLAGSQRLADLLAGNVDPGNAGAERGRSTSPRL